MTDNMFRNMLSILKELKQMSCVEIYIQDKK